MRGDAGATGTAGGCSPRRATHSPASARPRPPCRPVGALAPKADICALVSAAAASTCRVCFAAAPPPAERPRAAPGRRGHVATPLPTPRVSHVRLTLGRGFQMLLVRFLDGASSPRRVLCEDSGIAVVLAPPRGTCLSLWTRPFWKLLLDALSRRRGGRECGEPPAALRGLPLRPRGRPRRARRRPSSASCSRPGHVGAASVACALSPAWQLPSPVLPCPL